MKVCVVGLGEVGTAVYEDLLARGINVVAVDLPERVAELSKKYRVTADYPPADIYSICVYTTEQVFEVLEKIPKERDPLIMVESTIKPGSYELMKKYGRVVLFGHRYNPNDPSHRVFNLTRIMGSDNKEALDTALRFYRPLFDYGFEIIVFDPRICEVSRCLENSVRFVNIALAENLSTLCKEKGLDFSKVREAVSSKWNTPVLLARDGIGGTCLPKDMSICIGFFGEDSIFGDAKKRDAKYGESLGPRVKKIAAKTPPIPKEKE